MRTPMIPLLAVLAGAAAGCGDASLDGVIDNGQTILDDARDRSRDIIDGAQDRVELTSEELRELRAIEYRILRIPAPEIDTAQDQLNALGMDRWEAYHVTEGPDATVYHLKRPKSTTVADVTQILRILRYGSFVF